MVNTGATQDHKLAEESFKDRVRSFNRAVKIRTQEDPRVSFLHHRGMEEDWQSLMDEDGVHLNEEGLRKLVHSIRRELIRVGSKIIGEEERQV